MTEMKEIDFTASLNELSVEELDKLINYRDLRYTKTKSYFQFYDSAFGLGAQENINVSLEKFKENQIRILNKMLNGSDLRTIAEAFCHIGRIPNLRIVK